MSDQDPNPLRLPWSLRRRSEFDPMILNCDGEKIGAMQTDSPDAEEFLVAAVNACFGLSVEQLVAVRKFRERFERSLTTTPPEVPVNEPTNG